VREGGSRGRGRFARLHADGRGLIRGWFDGAWALRDGGAGECFEAFIFTWIALNGWAACVTGEDSDRRYQEALECDPELTSRFAALAADTGSALAGHAADFAGLWPILEVKSLRAARFRDTARATAPTWCNTILPPVPEGTSPGAGGDIRTTGSRYRWTGLTRWGLFTACAATCSAGRRPRIRRWISASSPPRLAP
jgi:hypothetical protein